MQNVALAMQATVCMRQWQKDNVTKDTQHEWFEAMRSSISSVYPSISLG